MRKITTLENYSDERGNKIISCVQQNSNIEKSKIDIVFAGYNCLLNLEQMPNISELKIEFRGDDSSVVIGHCTSEIKLRILIGSESEVIIHEGLSTTSMLYITANEKTGVYIGKDCMFAGAVQVRGDDSHPIFDVTTGKRINRSMPVVIDDHVWVGEGSVILKGTHIGSGSVIGTRSIVSGRYPNNVVVAGNPARIVRKNIAWERPHLTRHKLFDKEGELNDHSRYTKKYWNQTK